LLPLALFTALAISMALTPVMIRLAPRIGMVDMPDPRKVHAVAVPRVGGIGIVLGALAAILLWVPLQPWIAAYVLGSAVLFVFGALDDSLELGHYVKFVGQFIATAALVYWGDLWVSHLPFFADEVAPEIGKPFTMFALVGMINAINHSDGLDGLAGGESLLSLGCMAYLGYLAGGADFVVVVGAVVGGLIGFLRYNTHPARVFMGDAGSQFLGFSVGVLAVYLTQRLNSGLSMALPLLILGLPIVDILAVFAQRVYQRMNWFRATKNHVHHRLLALGFRHYEAVVAIYSVQAALVLSALAVRYESDWLVAALYAGVCAAVFGCLIIAERTGWRLRHAAAFDDAASVGPSALARLRKLPRRFVQITVPAYLVAVCALAASIPQDLGWAAPVLFCVTAASLLLDHWRFSTALSRVSLYIGSACVVYVLERSGVLASPVYAWLDSAYFVLLAVAVGAAIRVDPELHFHTTPLDFLLVIVVIAAGLVTAPGPSDYNLGSLILRLATLFYACELIVSARAIAHGDRLLRGSVLAVSLIMMGRVLAAG
jgi:UDP-GlcNAc:undecaprenyl-phosphate GlcNAc-1-phosphate transferase